MYYNARKRFWIDLKTNQKLNLIISVLTKYGIGRKKKGKIYILHNLKSYNLMAPSNKAHKLEKQIPASSSSNSILGL